MPIDTDVKRAAALATLGVFVLAPVIASGTFASSDLQHATHTYSGVLAAAPEEEAEFGDVSHDRTTVSATSLTYQHTVAEGEHLLVWVANSNPQSTHTVTYNGIPLTPVTDDGGTTFVFAYYLHDPPVGTFDVVFTSSVSALLQSAAISVSNVDFSDAHLTRRGGAGSPALWSTPAEVGSLVFEYTAVEASNPVWTIGTGGQVELFTESTAGSHNAAASYKEVAASPVSMSWDFTGGVFWGMGIVFGVGGVEVPPGGSPGQGGSPGEGVNPDLGIIPENPLTFIHIRTVEDEDYYFGVTQLNDDPGWYGGKKPGKLLHVSDITRRLGKRGAFEGTRVTCRIIDTDRQFRQLVATTTLRGSYISIYWIDDEDRRAELEPFRIFAGQITDHRGVAKFVYEITAHDALARKLALISQQPTIPPDRLTSSVFPGIDPAIEGHAAPIVVGLVSDHATATPQGVVPPKYLGFINFQSAFGGINHNVDAYIWTKGALPNGAIIDVYYNDPSDPNVRLVVPVAAWGNVVWTPYKPGWSDVGVATDYVDYNGERYTPFFVSRTLGDLADAVKDGRVLVAANLFGVEDVGDGSGSVFMSPSRIWQWVLVNWVFNRYQTGTYFAIPALDGVYSVIDTDTVEDANDAHHARIFGGYTAGLVLGRDGNPQSVFDALGELCEGADMEQGINRHGQLILKVENHLAAAEMSYTAYHVEDGTYEAWIESSELINRVEHEYGYLYTPPTAPAPTPAEGEPVPSKPLKDQPKWESGLVVNESVAAQDDIGGEVVTYKLQNYVVRDAGTAEDIEYRLLLRGLGPTNEGPRWFTLTGGPWLLGENGSPPIILDLGSVFEVSHPERIGSDILVKDRCRILEVTYHPLKKRVTYKGRILTGLSLVVSP